jgi:hypothetical protein
MSNLQISAEQLLKSMHYYCTQMYIFTAVFALLRRLAAGTCMHSKVSMLCTRFCL